MPKGKIMAHVTGTLPVCYMREGEAFVAYSPALDLSTFGRTFEEATRNFSEAAGLFFEECIEHNTLEQALEACGWTKAPKRGWEPPVFVGQRSLEIGSLVNV